MKEHIVELVVYGIKPNATEKYVAETIDSFRKLVMSFDGFISYQFFQGCKDKQLFMDFVLWDSLENAEKAGIIVAQFQSEFYLTPNQNSEKINMFNSLIGN